MTGFTNRNHVQMVFRFITKMVMILLSGIAALVTIKRFGFGQKSRANSERHGLSRLFFVRKASPPPRHPGSIHHLAVVSLIIAVKNSFAFDALRVLSLRLFARLRLFVILAVGLLALLAATRTPIGGIFIFVKFAQGQ